MKKKNSLYFFCIFLITQLEAKLIINKPVQVKNFKESVNFDCIHDYAFEKSVVWLKKGSLEDGSDDVLLSVRKSVLVDDRRVNVQYSLVHINTNIEQGVKLQIHDLSAADSGTYICMILSSDKTEKDSVAEATLNVFQPPIFANQTKKDVLVSIGDSIELECMPEANPKPIVTWLFGSREIHRGNKLQLEGIGEDDRGQYVCLAENEYGSQRLLIDLFIEAEPFVAAPRLVTRQSISSKEARLLCHVEGLPSPEIDFLKNGKKLLPGKKYKIESRYNSPTITDAVLQINNLGESDFGEYICMATNKLGKTKVVLTLVKQEENELSGRSFCKTAISLFEERNSVNSLKQCS